MVQFLSKFFFFWDFFNFCWVFQKLPFFLCRSVFVKYDHNYMNKTVAFERKRKSLLYAEMEVTKPSQYGIMGNRKTSEELIFYLRSK